MCHRCQKRQAGREWLGVEADLLTTRPNAAWDEVIKGGIFLKKTCEDEFPGSRLRLRAEHRPSCAPRFRPGAKDCFKLAMKAESTGFFQCLTNHRTPGSFFQGMLVILAANARAKHFADKGQEFLWTDVYRSLFKLFGIHLICSFVKPHD